MAAARTLPLRRREGPVQTSHSSSAEQPVDARIASLDSFIRRSVQTPSALIEVLHEAQRLFGFLRPDVLHHVAGALDLPPSKVYGVATFYHLFSLTPPAAHECVVCVGTTCYVDGAQAVRDAVERELGIDARGVDAAGRWRLSAPRCVGDCCHSPLVFVDGEAISRATPQAVIDAVRAATNRPSSPPRREANA
jgi:bidirectional [NiFe] hydrogenase diaphorase subunit